MAEPARKLDDQDENKRLSAMERARAQWGMPATSHDDEAKEPETESAAEEEKSALDRANERWGEAGVVDGGEAGKKKDKTEDSEDEGGFYKNEGKKRRLNIRGKLLTRRNGIIGGISAAIISLVMGAIVSIPGAMLQGLKSVLLDQLNKIQTHQQVRYRRSKLARVGDVFSRDGRLGSRVIADMEARGYRFSFDAETNDIRGITLPDRSRTIVGAGIGEHISDYMETRHPLRTSRWKTRRMEAFYTRFGVSRVSVVRPSPNDLEDADRTVNRNVANSIYEEDYDPRVTGETPGSENETEEQARARQEGDDLNRQLADNGGDFGETKTDISTNGTPIDEAAGDLAQHADDIATGNTASVLEVAERAAKGGLVSWNSFKSIFSTTDILDKVCTVKNRLRGAVTAARSVRALGGLKYATIFVNAADDSRTGQSRMSLLNSLMKRVTSVDRNGNPIGGSPGFAYALKGRFSSSRNDAVKSSYSVDGKLTGVYKGVQDATNGIPGMSQRQCGIYQNPVFQIGVSVVEIGIAIFTGGSSKAVSETAKQTVIQTVKQTIRASLNRSLARSLARSIATAMAVELSFEGIMALTQMYAEKSLTYNFTGQEVGGELGGILVGGAGTMHKQRNLMAGQVPATTTQYAAAVTDDIEYDRQQNSKQSVFAKVFDINNSDSLAFSALWRLPTSFAHAGNMFSGGLTGLASSLANGPGTLFSSAATALSPKAFAQDADEVSFETYVTEGNNSGIELATDPAGNVQTVLRSDIAAIDPEENIEVLSAGQHIDPISLEPTSDAFKNHISNCIDDIDTLSRIEGGNFSNPAEDCMATQPITVRFKAHLAYLDMLDGLEAEFIPETILPVEGGPPTGPGSNTGASAQYIPDCNANGGNAKIACVAIDTMLGVPYKNGYSGRPGCRQSPDPADTPNPVSALDCSAFTSMAVYRAFGIAGPRTSVLYRTDPNFQELSDPKTMQPGDMIGRGTVASGSGGNGHIGIVVSYNPATGDLVTVETDSCNNNSRIVTTKGLRQDGKGTYEWVSRYVGPKNAGGVF